MSFSYSVCSYSASILLLHPIMITRGPVLCPMRGTLPCDYDSSAQFVTYPAVSVLFLGARFVSFDGVGLSNFYSPGATR